MAQQPSPAKKQKTELGPAQPSPAKKQKTDEAPDNRPVVKEVKVMKLAAINHLHRDSGWRNVDQERVQELIAKFVGGEFGLCVGGCDVSVLEKTDAEGKFVIDDGLNTHTALVTLEERYQAGNVDDGEEWDAKLIDVFRNGYKVKVVKYPIDHSREARKVYQAGKHNIDNNRFKITSVSIIVEIGEYALRLHDKKKDQAMAYLCAQHGKSAKSTAWTWITAGEQLSSDTKKALAGLDRLKPSLILLNPYFVGNATNAKERLDTKFQLYALDR